MKTLLSILSLLALTLGAIALGAYHLDFGDCSMAAMVAALFGVAFNDRSQAERLRPRLG
jgi:uncharacterized membrane protein YoaK (UPF0700 family)